jgi:hypothetical protein
MQPSVTLPAEPSVHVPTGRLWHGSGVCSMHAQVGVAAQLDGIETQINESAMGPASAT